MLSVYHITQFSFLHSICPYMKLYCSLLCLYFIICLWKLHRTGILLIFGADSASAPDISCHHRYQWLLTASICDILCEASSSMLVLVEGRLKVLGSYCQVRVGGRIPQFLVYRGCQC